MTLHGWLDPGRWDGDRDPQPGAFGDQSEVWVPIVTCLAILTMTVANLVALAQTNIKRLLAFSSISHAGYLLIALVCKPERAVSAIAFYLTAYAFMTVGAFVVVWLLSSVYFVGPGRVGVVSRWGRALEETAAPGTTTCGWRAS